MKQSHCCTSIRIYDLIDNCHMRRNLLGYSAPHILSPYFCTDNPSSFRSCTLLFFTAKHFVDKILGGCNIWWLTRADMPQNSKHAENELHKTEVGQAPRGLKLRMKRHEQATVLLNLILEYWY